MGKEGPKLKAKRHTPNQVIRKLRDAELMLAEGRSIAEVAKALEVSEVTFHRWRAAGSSASALRRQTGRGPGQGARGPLPRPIG